MAKDHPKASYIRNLSYRQDKSYAIYKTYVEDKGAENAANVMICVIHQANFLLDRLKRQLDKQFREEGGFTERLYNSRKKVRKERPTA